MNKTTSIIALVCGVVIIARQIIEMFNGRPTLLAVGCLFVLAGLVGLFRAKYGPE